MRVARRRRAAPRPVCRVAVASSAPSILSARAAFVAGNDGLQETLDRLGLYWKRDPDFVPVKDKGHGTAECVHRWRWC